MPLYSVAPPQSNPSDPDSGKIAQAQSSYWVFLRRGNMVCADFNTQASSITIDKNWRTYGVPPVGFRPIGEFHPTFGSAICSGMVNFNSSGIQFYLSTGTGGNLSYVRCYLSYFKNDPFPS